MDSSITAAGRALGAGDPLGALKRVALRDDPPALALRGIAMAQLGEHGARARAAAAGGARLRTARDGRAGPLPDGRGGGRAGGARSRLAVAGAGRGAAHVRRARRSRERGPRAAAPDPAPPAARTDRRGGGRVRHAGARRRARAARGRRRAWSASRSRCAGDGPSRRARRWPGAREAAARSGIAALRAEVEHAGARAGPAGRAPRRRGRSAVADARRGRGRCSPRPTSSSTAAVAWPAGESVWCGSRAGRCCSRCSAASRRRGPARRRATI